LKWNRQTSSLDFPFKHVIVYKETKSFSNIVSNSPKKSTKLVAHRCQWHRCACHSRVNDNAVHVTAVSMTSLCMSQRCQDTDVHITVLSMKMLCNQLWKIFSWINQNTIFMQKFDWAAHCTAPSLTPLWHVQQCQWHRCDMHSGVNDTAVKKTYVGKFSNTISYIPHKKVGGGG
jgi:hypothetical protein